MQDGFIEDLASCCAVLTAGGHTIIAEALALHKPLCCFPTSSNFAEVVNARYVERMGMAFL